MHHNGHKHPAKSRGLRVRSNKVEFSLVNRVSLIFKELDLSTVIFRASRGMPSRLREKSVYSNLASLGGGDDEGR